MTKIWLLSADSDDKGQPQTAAGAGLVVRGWPGDGPLASARWCGGGLGTGRWVGPVVRVWPLGLGRCNPAGAAFYH
jgi:hypothetical protein